MNIRWTHFDSLSPHIRAQVEGRLSALASEHHDLIDVHLIGYESARHRHGDREVCIVCRARGREVVVRRHREELGLALVDALDAAERAIRDQRDRVQRMRRRRPSLASYEEYASQYAGGSSQ